MTMIERLRWRTLVQHGGPHDGGWNLSSDDSLMHSEVADELERLQGETAVLVRILMEADKVVSTIEGECQEEWDQLADLRRAIAAATVPHRPEEADLLSLRACIGA